MFDTKKTRQEREADGLVLNATNVAEAGMYQEILQNAGIPSIVKGHGAGGIMQIYMGYAASGLGIYVDPGKREEALALLQPIMTPVEEWEQEE